MAEQPPKNSTGLVSTETKITGFFIIVALVSWLGTTAVTDSQWVHLAVLLAVGIIVPTLINEWRN